MKFKGILKMLKQKGETDPNSEKDSKIREKSKTTLHIGSGSMKGRKIFPPPAMTTRPMTSMVKKSLFSILTASGKLAGGIVLDLYAGTGTLGLESLSCGAGHCYFAERDRQALNRLKRNIQTCSLTEKSTVWAGNIENRLADWLAELPAGHAVDIAFIDPPYPAVRKWSWDKMIERIFQPLSTALEPDGIVVLRLPDDVEVSQKLGKLNCQRLKKYGQMNIGFYGKT